MRIVTLPRAEIVAFASSGVHMSFLPQLGRTEGARVHVAAFGPGGTLGEHPAQGWQVFAVVEGECLVWVAGQDAAALSAGQAAVWGPGEVHGSRAARAATIVIVESAAEPVLDENFHLLDH